MVQQAVVGWGGWGVSGWINPFRRGFIKENTWTKSSFLQSIHTHFLLVTSVGLLPMFQPLRLKFCEQGRLVEQLESNANALLLPLTQPEAQSCCLQPGCSSSSLSAGTHRRVY